MNLGQNVLERFLRYVQIDTGSNESSETAPSTMCQFDLLRLLEKELGEIGLAECVVNRGGVLTARLPSNIVGPQPKTIAFIAHVDTYPGTPNQGVKPQVHENYDGQDIILPAGGRIIVKENPELARYAGGTVITADGSTLLGADDKAGVAEIMTALEYLTANPDVPHGEILIAFTPDEEIGRGTANFPLADFKAYAAYTLDGGAAGEVENETFCADSAIIHIKGKDVHPGYAKGKMVNAVRAAATMISMLPQDTLPETTEKKQGYVHPLGIEGDVNNCRVTFIVRDFEMEGLKTLEAMLQDLMNKTIEIFPGLAMSMEVKHSYKNMRFYLDNDARIVDFAMEAVKRAGVTPLLQAIRGGTDGSRLSEMGLPTPNLFAGGRNFHSVNEWVPQRDMEQAVEVILNLVQIWREATD